MDSPRPSRSAAADDLPAIAAACPIERKCEGFRSSNARRTFKIVQVSANPVGLFGAAHHNSGDIKRATD